MNEMIAKVEAEKSSTSLTPVKEENNFVKTPTMTAAPSQPGRINEAEDITINTTGREEVDLQIGEEEDFDR